MFPVAGSAYAYAYAAIGEFWAWMIGWDLVLEYGLAVALVAIGWSEYFVTLVSDTTGYAFPAYLIAAPDGNGGGFNLPAFLIVVVITRMSRTRTLSTDAIAEHSCPILSYLASVFD
jgi:APA family basic amino acid/polyamine antiporter